MQTRYGRPAESVRRFSFAKWSVAGLLLAALLLTWLAAPEPQADTPPIAADVPAAAGEDRAPASASRRAADARAAGDPTSLAIEIAGNGSLKVHGMVADEATRNQWLNEIRLGAQGARVVDELRVGPVSPAAAGWVGQLSALVAVMRQRGLTGLRVDGDKVQLKGAVENPADKVDTEKMIQAQLPSGYQLESQLAVGPVAAASAPSAGSPSKDAPAGGNPPVAGAWPETGKSTQTEGARATAEPPARKTVRPPANCPRHLRALTQPVYFDTDAASIEAGDRNRLLRLGACLGRARLRIIGYADPRHTEDYNRQLSERRARAVADAVIEGGAAASRISVIGAGQARPDAEGVSRQGLQRSRRVDILLR